jgi:hypothetical protein
MTVRDSPFLRDPSAGNMLGLGFTQVRLVLTGADTSGASRSPSSRCPGGIPATRVTAIGSYSWPDLVSVEGTGGCGAWLTRDLQHAGIFVVEVEQPYRPR